MTNPDKLSEREKLAKEIARTTAANMGVEDIRLKDQEVQDLEANLLSSPKDSDE